MVRATLGGSRRSAVETLNGSITSVAFTSGHQFVVGCWRESPIGPFADVMWSRPDGTRALVAAHPVAEYVTSVYPFEELQLAQVTVQQRGRRLAVDAGDVQLRLHLGRLAAPFPPRPRWVTATVENTIAGWTLEVCSFGTSPTGVEEWYRTRTVRGIRSGSATVGARSCGELRPLQRPIGFGFTDPPERPTHVSLRVDLRRPE